MTAPSEPPDVKHGPRRPSRPPPPDPPRVSWPMQRPMPQARNEHAKPRSRPSTMRH